MTQQVICQIMGGIRDGEHVRVSEGKNLINFKVVSHGEARILTCPIRDNKIYWHEGVIKE